MAFQDQLTREIGSVPGVATAVSSTHVPLSGATWSHFFRVAGAASERKASRFAYVSPGYFETLRIPIRSGRDFQDLDNARSRRVMVVNESFVRSHLDGLDPLGTTVRTLEEPGSRRSPTRSSAWSATPSTRTCATRTAGVRRPASHGPDCVRADRAEPEPVRLGAGDRAVAHARRGALGHIAQRVERLGPGIAIQFSELNTRVRSDSSANG